MSKLIIYSAAAKPDAQDNIVALWKHAVLGDSGARQAFLRRIMPAGGLENATAAGAELLEVYRKPIRAAA